MSKQIQKVRISQLAKDLGVDWKDIKTKCESEGVVDQAKTASSTVSIGLAETIREWFGNGGVATATAVETTAKVEARPKAKPEPRTKAVTDSTTVDADAPSTAKGKKAPPRTTKPSTDSATGTEATATAPEVIAGTDSSATAAPAAANVVAKTAPVVAATMPEAATEVHAPTAKSAPVAVPSVAAFSMVIPEVPELDLAPRLPGEDISVVTSPESVAPHTVVGAPVSPSVIGKAHRSTKPAEPVPAVVVKPPVRHTIQPASSPPLMNVPKRPEIVRAIGQTLTPTKTALSGPQVIRVEQAENLPVPRPRPAGGPGGPGFGGSRFGGSGGSGAGRGPGRTTPSSRTGRAADSRGRDYAAGGGGSGTIDKGERDKRLAEASGWMKNRRHKTGGGGHGGGGARVEQGPPSEVHITEPISIKELSEKSGVKASDILKQLVLAGQMATINGSIETERAIEIMMGYEIELIVEEAKSVADIIEERFTARVRTEERARPPVVTILGHVDHGKTSLLDRIRNTNVASGEAGGITQATSAFQVPVKAGDKERVVTFIDTPGHEAFTQMRARGARVTDIVVLVVAADDGVMPQTIESINHAKAAGVPIVVVLNKIDKAEATANNIQRILGQLAEHGLNPVEWGGETEVLKVSATKGTGIQELLEMLDYVADLRDFKADAKGLAQGTCLEAQMEEGRGTVARIIVQEGQLKKGDFIVVGRAYGRVRDIVNDRGQRIESASASTPVAISGLDVLPDAGDKFYCVKSVKEAEQAALERRRIERERELAAPKITLDNIFEHMGKGGVKELPLVVKGDVQGSVETLRIVLGKIRTDEVAVSVKHCAVGGINESDVALAEATKAIIVGFNVTSNSKARALAEAKGIEMRLYEVIYDLTDDVAKAASGLLEPELKLEVIGHADVREVYKITKVGAIAGCYVTDGVVERNAQIRVTRGGIVIEKDRRLEQLKRFKDDAKEVRSGNECGMKIDGYNDIKVGDVLECYRTVKVQRSLGAMSGRKD
ncbi:MAG: translation initiation factor IF-2 [Planctomycetota bacterium]